MERPEPEEPQHEGVKEDVRLQSERRGEGRRQPGGAVPFGERTQHLDRIEVIARVLAREVVKRPERNQVGGRHDHEDDPLRSGAAPPGLRRFAEPAIVTA